VLKKIACGIFLLVSVFIIMSALYLYVNKDLIQDVDAYRLEINTYVSRTLGMKIESNKLEGGWHQFAPQLSVTNVSVYAGQRDKPAVTINKARFKINLIQTILSQRLILRELNISHIDISMEESSLGSWTIAGKSLGGDETGLLDDLLDSRYLEIESIGLRLKFLSGAESIVKAHNIRLENQDDFHRLLSTVSLPGVEHPVDVIVEAKGQGVKDLDFSAYLELDNFNFNNTINNLVKNTFPDISENIVDLKANIDGAFWIQAKKDKTITLSGNLYSDGIYHSLLKGAGPITKLNAGVSGWYSPDQGWGINLHDLSWDWDDLQAKSLVVNIAQKTPDGLESVSLSVNQIDLTLLGEMLKKMPITFKDFSDTLQKFQPAGNIRNLHLVVDGKSTNSDIQLKANLDNVSLRSWGGNPGVREVNGYLEVSNESGFLELDSPNGFALYLPGTFDDFLRRSSIRGQISWRHDPINEAIKVFSGPLEMHGDEGQSSAYFYLDIPVGAEDLSPEIYFIMGIKDLDSRHKELYIPDNLNKNLGRWLNQAMVDIKIHEAGFVWQGPVGARKNNKVKINREASTQVYLRTIDGELKFHKNWPSLIGLNSIITVDASKIDAEIFSARIGQVEISKANLSINPEKDIEAPYVHILGSIKSDLGEAVDVLARSPLKSRVIGLADWDISGESTISLNAKIPLTEHNSSSYYSVDAIIDQGLMSLPDTQVSLKNLQGVLSYRDERGLFSPSLRGDIFGAPFAASLETLEEDLSIEMHGDLGMSSLVKLLELPSDKALKGQANFMATLLVPHEDPSSPIRLNVKTDMSGAAINLPEPFGKKANVKENVEVNIIFSDVMDLRVDMGGLIRSHLEFKKGSVVRGVLAIESDRLELPGKGHILTVGHLKSFSLSQWNEAYPKIFNLDGERKSSLTPLFEISIDQLDAVGLNIEQVEVNGGYQAGDWMLGIKSNLMAGHLWVPQDTSVPILIDLEKLFLPALSKSGGAPDILNPASLPHLQLSVRNFSVGDKKFGKVKLLMEPQSMGIKITDIDANFLGLKIGGQENDTSIEWTENNGQHHTKFQGSLGVNDIGETLKSWGFPVMMDSKKAQFLSQLSWHGRPWEASPVSMKGSVSMHLEDGHFYQESSGATNALIRLVGLFNFDNWIRRLQLDFSDLYEKGMSYNKMDGGLLLDEGEVTFDPVMIVNLPSGGIELEGKVSLISEKIDARLLTKLPVSNNLPWVAAAVGGLPVAAGVFVTSKLFEKQVENLSSISYSIKGSLSDPKIKMEKIFNIDTSGKIAPKIEEIEEIEPISTLEGDG
jgi:uncharacterized protein (TIGR02099 family)